MKFIDFLNESENGFVKLSDVKREFKKIWKLTKPYSEDYTGRKEYYMNNKAQFVDDKKVPFPDGIYKRNDKVAHIDKEIEKFFIDNFNAEKRTGYDKLHGSTKEYVFNKDTKKEFSIETNIRNFGRNEIPFVYVSL